MKTRLELEKVEPAAVRAVMGLESYVRSSGLDKTLVDRENASN